ncbi:MAG TPA: hypothetical protein VGE67_19715, partial [Haloferula sp.]
MQPEKQRALIDALRKLGEKEFWIESIEPPVFQNIFERYRRVFDGYAVEMAKPRGVEPIPFLFVHRSTLNAFAFREGEHTFVGIHWGSVILLHDIFFR